MKRSNSDSTFDIVEFYKASRIQIATIEYLRMNTRELNKLIEYVHQSSPDVVAKKINEVKTLGSNEISAKQERGFS